ncbi:transcriptional activator of glycolytic enzymes-domain-containing protein [Chaetomidium leptoderma]|uniref:Transcriptional activator of glycolytic enzymes-domain-containing protein n=1 Tax=Chaetomidium leptoderma TaxID=669021 RepID=A0AAN6VBS3_9PEZI|nr:transcriptional activator of glycolytic enzymes-domain-containing protein [Chaetomidium leptoderma]
MTGCYLTTLPLEFMRAVADFDPEWSGSYFIPRSTVKPPSRLLVQLFPDLDYWRELHEAPESSEKATKVDQDKAAGAFLELLDWLREVVLQDAVFLQPLFPLHPVFRAPVFRSPEFDEFAGHVRRVCAEIHEDTHQAAIDKAMPAVGEKLRVLATQQVAQEALSRRRHEELVQKLGNLEETVQKLSATSYTVTISPKGRHIEQHVELPRARRVQRRRREPSLSSSCCPPRRSPAPVAGHGTSLAAAAAAAVSSQPEGEDPARMEEPVEGAAGAAAPDEAPPRYTFPESVKTVIDLQRLWRHGLPPMPSIESLEERWGSKWRPRRQRQFFSVRRQIFDEIVRRSRAQSAPEDVSAREMDRERGNDSLDKFLKTLKAQREKGAE